MSDKGISPTSGGVSDTPRTDAIQRWGRSDAQITCDLTDLARQLERELAAKDWELQQRRSADEQTRRMELSLKASITELERSAPSASERSNENREEIWSSVRLLAEGSDWKRDQGETLGEWAWRTIKKAQSARSGAGERDAIIEECAKVCMGTGEEGESPDCWGWHAKDYANAIRSLKNRTPQVVEKPLAGPAVSVHPLIEGDLGVRRKIHDKDERFALEYQPEAQRDDKPSDTARLDYLLQHMLSKWDRVSIDAAMSARRE